MTNINAFAKFDLSGRTAVVTAGGTGIGYYMARGLARSGAKVLIAARREQVLKTAAKRLQEESGGTVIHDTVDLNDRASIKAFTERALANLGGVDIFIGNAGRDIFEPLDRISDQVIDEMFQVNVSSVVEMMRAFLPGMRQKKWGRILFSSATSSLVSSAQEGMAIYAATKSALNSLARTAAVECGHDGITVNALTFGTYVTDMLSELLEQIEAAQGKEAAQGLVESLASITARGRLGRPDEVEGLIQFLASEAGGYITGSSLAADGGMAIMLRPNPPPENPVYPPPF